MEQKKRIHPHKFTLWVGLASIIMMFAGFTSAYIIKRNQANWVTFDLPGVFWYSTAVIIISSITLWLAHKAFKNREMIQYRNLVVATLHFDLLLQVLQILAFRPFYLNVMTL